MALKIKDMKELVKVVVAGSGTKTAYSFGEEQYDYNDLQALLREELKGLAPDYNAYRRNKLTIFEIIQTGVDTVLPKKVIEILGEFADIQFFAQGKKPEFTKRVGRNRAKQFITKVGLSGVYETFRLDTETFGIETYAIGGAAQMELERFLDGMVDFGELFDIVVEGMEDAVYREIESALINAIGSLPAKNRYSGNGLVESEMVKLITTVKAYGPGAMIYCTEAFAQTMLPNATYVTDADKNELRTKGYVAIWKGAQIVILPQSFTDESNTDTVINDQYAYVLPTGQNANEKAVKIAFEGDTVVDEYKNRDRSTEVQAYRKFGVGIINNSHWAAYRNTSL